MDSVFLKAFCCDVFKFFFFFNDTATTEIYTLSLHDALPISTGACIGHVGPEALAGGPIGKLRDGDRKSTRLNSSHSQISYAVFCLKKKKASRTNPRAPVESRALPSYRRHRRDRVQRSSARQR